MNTTASTVEPTRPGARVLSSRPAALCPDHGCVLDEGPVHYRCPEGHAVMSGSLDREVTR